MKAVIPGGSSAKVFKAGESYKLKQKQPDGTMVGPGDRHRGHPDGFRFARRRRLDGGSGGVIVMDDTRDMVVALNNINEFYAHESCGQCTPCREGSLWMRKITDRMLDGGGVRARSGRL